MGSGGGRNGGDWCEWCGGKEGNTLKDLGVGAPSGVSGLAQSGGRGGGGCESGAWRVTGARRYYRRAAKGVPGGSWTFWYSQPQRSHPSPCGGKRGGGGVGEGEEEEEECGSVVERDGDEEEEEEERRRKKGKK